MFNPHIHQQQQQQQQQFHQHLRQIQQLLQQQPPPPPPQPPPQHHVAHHHHHQAQRPMPSQTAPSPRMVNLCQATQTTIIAPNPMLQGALLMQQMQGNMRGFAMGGQQFRQFFSAGARSSLLGPVPMGMTMKSPLMGYPAARHYHPHPRFYNNINNNHASTSTSTDYRQPDRKRDNEQRAAASANGQSATSITADASDKVDTAAASGDAAKSTTGVVDLTDEPAVKKPRTEESEEQAKQTETIELDTENPAEDAGCIIVEEVGSTTGSEILEGIEKAGNAQLDEEGLAEDAVLEETPADPDAPPAPRDVQDDHLDGTNKFYCYLCSITCHSQQNFRSHMNGVSHQHRMMEVQHMSNAGLVTLLPRMQESLLAAQKDGEKRAEPQHWCPSCGLHLTSGATDHRCNKEHQQLGSLAGPTCTVCKKTFKSPQLFVEHMRSQEHRHRVEQEKQRFGALSGLDPEGLQRDQQEGIAAEGEGEMDETSGSYQLDELSARTEVTLESMSVDEEYKADTVYGSRFLVPVAGFLCRLCNRFYHFESSALHSHCKSLTHFEHLKKHNSLKSSQQDKPPATTGSEAHLWTVSEQELLDDTTHPAAASDPDQPGPPAEPQGILLGGEAPPAASPLVETKEEEEEQLLSLDPSGQPAGAGPEADCNQAELVGAPKLDEEPSGGPLAKEEPAEMLLAEKKPACTPLAKEEPADVLLDEVVPPDTPLAEEAPEPALYPEEVPAEEEEAGAVGEKKGTPQKKSTGKVKATPKRKSKRR